MQIMHIILHIIPIYLTESLRKALLRAPDRPMPPIPVLPRATPLTSPAAASGVGPDGGIGVPHIHESERTTTVTPNTSPPDHARQHADGGGIARGS